MKRQPLQLIAFLSTGVIAAAAFPPLAWRDAAWIAYVPLLLAAPALAPRRAFAWGWLSGLVFWGLSVFWLTRVTWPGWIGLAAYCALYTALFSGGAGFVLRRSPAYGWLILPALWCGLEYLRSTLATGFPWNHLGVSQYTHIPMIQMASVGGVYAVSALVMFLNAALAATVRQYIDCRGRWGKRPHWELMAALLAVGIVFSAGLLRVRHMQAPERRLRIGLVQPNIEQHLKWNPEDIEHNRLELERWSRAAVLAGPPDLLIQPETALPDFLRDDEEGFAMLQRIATQGVHILTGAMDYEWTRHLRKPVQYYNTSFLIDPRGRIVNQYDKQHLVLFGEYVPLEDLFPFLGTFTPIEGSFTPGSTATVFRVQDVPFSALICFEDTMAALARRAVRNGARLLINQTNDAWFDPLAGSRQHLAQSVFRSVENRVPMVRCANTGVSGWIDAAGRIRQIIADREGRVQTAGFLVNDIGIPPDDMPMTFYNRHGDWFAQSCLAITVGIFIWARLSTRKKDAGFRMPDA